MSQSTCVESGIPVLGKRETGKNAKWENAHIHGKINLFGILLI